MTVFMDDFNTQSYSSDHIEYMKKTLKKCLNEEKNYLAIQQIMLLGYVMSEKKTGPRKNHIH